MSKLIVLTEEQAAEMIQANVAAATHGAVEHLTSRMKELEEGAYASKPVLTHKQAAAYCEIDYRSILRWISEEGLPASKHGKTYYIKRADLEDWLMRNKVTQISPCNHRQAA